MKKFNLIYIVAVLVFVFLVTSLTFKTNNSVTFYGFAENKETELKIRSQLGDIKERLRNKDIEIEKLDCFCAPLQSEQKPKITNRLIDVRT